MQQKLPILICTLATMLFLSITVAAQEIPVVVNQTSDAKVMLMLDDSGSMNAVIEHGDFDADSAEATNSTNRIPSAIFRIESGNNAPSTNQDATPVLFEMNWGLWGLSGGSVYESTRLSNISNNNFVRSATCNNSNAQTVWCPGSPNAYRGIGVFQSFNNANDRGSAAFDLGHITKIGAANAEDVNGNEYLNVDYRRNDYVRSGRNWHGIWAKFDNDGNAVTVNTRAYVTLGGTVVFNEREVFLSAGWYREEYLRWIFYVATADQLATLPGATRMETVKDVVEDLIINNPGVSFGLATLNGSTYNPGVHNSGSYGSQMWTPEGDAVEGGQPKIRAAIGTAQAALISKLQGITSFGGTPLANTYIEVLRYFAGESDRDPYCSGCNYTSPIQTECDASFVIMLTDGLPSSESHNFVLGSWIRDYDGDGDEGTWRNRNCSSSTCAEFLDDAAYFGFNNDFNNTLEGLQNIRSYAVGLGLDFDLLDDFAANGGSGQSLRANTADEITSALNDIVGNLVTTAVGAAGVAVAEVFGEEGQVFRPRFEAAHWTGSVDKFYSVGGTLVKVFDMGEILEQRDVESDSRVIIAGLDPDGDGNTAQSVAFTSANAATLRPELFELYDDGTLTSSLLGDPISDYADNESAEILIDYIHGIDTDGLRRRDSNADGNVEKLGDIVYSRPRYVGKRNGKYTQMAGYTNFVRSLSDEEDILLVGANDGMLHAFDVNTGEELWAYIPSSLLKYLEVLARPSYANQYHRYYVNGQITVEDVYVGGGWKTVAFFGLAEGGTSWVALDITDRSEPQLLFEVSSETFGGESWNEASVVVTNGPAGSNNPSQFSWYVVFPSGEEKPGNGNNLLVYPIQSGVPPMTKVTITAGESAGTRLSSIATVQNDTDLNVDRAYVGSESGDLYRVITNGVPSAWSVTRLFDDIDSRPITSRPVAVLVDNPNYDPSATSGTDKFRYAVGVYFGSGRYDTIADVTTIGTTQQHIVGIFDPIDISDDQASALLSTVSRGDLEHQSVSNFDPEKDADGIYRLDSNEPGFYIKLDTQITLSDGHYIEPVGMVTHPPINVRGNVIFSTFLPIQNQCSAGGYGFIQGVNFRAAGGSLADYYVNATDPFFNGGIHDLDEDGDKDRDDVELGISEGKMLPVLDTYVESVDLSSSRPYTYDGQLTANDIWIDPIHGGAKPVVSSLGANGVPGPPSVLYEDGQIVIQAAYISQETGGEGTDVEEETQVTICHYPNGLGDPESRYTLTVPESQLQTYLTAGDTMGGCPEDDGKERMTICFNNGASSYTMQILASEWPTYQAGGSTEGACEDDTPEEGGGDDEEELEKPEQLPVNLYNQPVEVLSFHESTGE